MTVRKLSIALQPEVAAAVVRSACVHGESVSAWIDRAARQALGVEDGLAAMDDYEREFGAFTAEELAEADRMIAEDAEAQRNRRPRASR